MYVFNTSIEIGNANPGHQGTDQATGDEDYTQRAKTYTHTMRKNAQCPTPPPPPPHPQMFNVIVRCNSLPNSQTTIKQVV